MDRELRVVLSARVFSDQKCFGPGVSQLLKRVDELHSLRAAALSMSMAYSKAWTVVRNAEDGLGFHLLTSTAGGKHGGGAVLTDEARQMLTAYDECAPTARSSLKRPLPFTMTFPSRKCIKRRNDMLGKLCVCGHEMKPQGKQTLEMNGSSLGSNLWTDHVEVDMYICSWCGRMAFFEPEDVREKRFRDACEEMTMDELRAIVYDANPDMLRAVARERIEELESIERYKAEQKQKEEERRAKRKKLFSGILGRDEDDGKPPKNRPPEF